jgi:hypothetical protein
MSTGCLLVRGRYFLSTSVTSTFIAGKYCLLFTRHFNNKSCFRGCVRPQYLRFTLALHLQLSDDFTIFIGVSPFAISVTDVGYILAL